LRRGGELILEALVEADALAPGERVGLMGVVGGDEVGEGQFGGVEVRELGALEALLAEDCRRSRILSRADHGS
jgi:hypothetical protein